MRNNAIESHDPAAAALIVLYGNTSKRWRPLQADLLLLGRSPRCDVGIDAPEIAPVHTLVLRRPDGWYVRDCGSRTGTRLNGRMIHESRLHDGDTLQVGTFSFEAHLPAERHDAVRPLGVPAGADAVSGKILRSRQRLARLALRLRRRLREASVLRMYPRTDQGLLQREADLNRQAGQLQERLRDAELRMARVEQAERELAMDRETLDTEYAGLHARMERAEQQLSHRQAEVEADLRTRWGNSEGQSSERKHARSESHREREQGGEDRLREEQRRLALRGEELNHFAQHLARANQQLVKQHLESAAKLVEMDRLREENARLRRLVEERPSDSVEAKSGLSAELAAWRREAPKKDTYFPNEAGTTMPREFQREPA